MGGNFNFNISFTTSSSDTFSGYTPLYSYNLSATSKDNVYAYYLVPNKNTEELTTAENKTKANSFSVQTISNTTEQSSNTVIERNGIKYTLSDEDKLIITGTGNMKENVQQDLYGYSDLQKDVSKHFGKENVYEDIYGDIRTKMPENTTCFLWSLNDLTPYYVTFTGDGYATKSVETEVTNYIDTIKDKYINQLCKTLIIQDGVTNISNTAFYNCTSLTSVTIPDSVTSIVGWTFMNCTNLASITLPNSLSVIPQYMFNNCTSLTSVTIPDSVTSIGDCAFENCTSLTSIAIPSGVTSLPSNLFISCNSSAFTIYCQSQTLADFINKNWVDSEGVCHYSVVVDASFWS